MGAFTWKSVLLPPIFALALYAVTTYLVLPYYRHLRARSSYSLLPSSQSSSNNPSLTTRLLSRIQALVGRSKRRASSNSLLGDEELEEGFDNLSDEVIRGRDDVAVDSDTEGDTRLSRELEGGFEIRVMRMMMIEDGEEDDGLDVLQNIKLCELSKSKAVAAVQLLRMLKSREHRRESHDPSNPQLRSHPTQSPTGSKIASASWSSRLRSNRAWQTHLGKPFPIWQSPNQSYES